MENVLKSGRPDMDQSAMELELLNWCRKATDG